MHPASDLHTSLEASGSVASIRAELDIISVLRKQHWQCYHGAFYRDGTEGKLREIDVLGRQYWERNTKRRFETSHLNLIVEAKSAKDWQIIFSEDQSCNEPCGYTTRTWSGFVGHDRYQWLREALLGSGIDQSNIPLLVAQFVKKAFTNENAVMPPCIDPPAAKHIVTAFRETNIGKEKDLENSVFWRAASGLRSATMSLERASEKWHAEWFSDPALQGLTGSDLLDQFNTICDISLGFIHIYHPIVVMDSNLWLVEAQTLTPIDSCRFYQLDHTGMVSWWCDVVHSSAFSSHAQSLSEYYAKSFKRMRSSLSRKS